jgi:hypothetical protein
MKSGSARAASQGISRVASHCPADACSASSETSSAQIASRSLSVQEKAGAPRSGIAPSGANPEAASAADGTSSAVRRSDVCSCPPRSGGPDVLPGSGSARTRADGPRSISTAYGPPGGICSPTVSCPACRAQPWSSRAVERDEVRTSRRSPGVIPSSAAVSRTSSPPPSSSSSACRRRALTSPATCLPSPPPAPHNPNGRPAASA